jgi:hypothetical protein
VTVIPPQTPCRARPLRNRAPQRGPEPLLRFREHGEPPSLIASKSAAAAARPAEIVCPAACPSALTAGIRGKRLHEATRVVMRARWACC